MNSSPIFVLILFGLALLAAYSIFAPFLLPIVVATLMVMATFNLTRYFVQKFSSKKLSTLVMVILLIMLILAPIFYAATSGVAYLSQIDQNTIQMIVTKAKLLVKDIPYLSVWADEYLRTEKITPYLTDISLYITKMGSAGLGFLRDLLLVIAFYAAINYHSDKFFELLKALIPVSRVKSAQMLNEVSSTMEVVFYSIIVTAIFEGLLFGFFVSYFGFNGLLFGVLYGFASLIPIIGGAILWIPLSLFAWSELGSSTAIAIALYSIIMISIIADTFIKPIIIKVIKEDLLHNSSSIGELIIFFSILAGMTSYGFWGAIIGPAITTFLFATSKIYIEYNQKHAKNGDQ
ncbi:MAG: AI-2E family transporter [Sulfurovum sp.]|nr:AI-2E family transporter [Sulfurovum sp.]